MLLSADRLGFYISRWYLSLAAKKLVAFRAVHLVKGHEIGRGFFEA